MPGVRVTGVRTLAGLVARARGEELPDVELAERPRRSSRRRRRTTRSTAPTSPTCWARPTARYLLEVAAAGGHHLLMTGPPGAGKTMLAERLPGLLPPLDRGVRARGDGGALGRRDRCATAPARWSTRPPFQAPHHTASVAAIVGGGSTQVRPGAASLAHRGVLFMDEAPEFAPAVLDALREPLESGEITVARLAARVRFPARFQLVLAANPCPCGLAVDRAGTDVGLQLHADGPAALPGPAVRPAARPGRPADRDAGRDPGRPARRRGRGGEHRGRRRAGGGGAGADGGPAGRHAVAGQRRGARPRPAAALAAALGGRRRGRAAARPRCADGPRRRPGGAGRLDAGRPGRARPAGRRRRPAGPGLPRRRPGGRRDRRAGAHGRGAATTGRPGPR